MDLVPLTFCLLRRGPRAAEYDDAELDRLQAGHLAFLDRMRAEGTCSSPGRSASRRTRRCAGSASSAPGSRRPARSSRATRPSRPAGWPRT
jgi:hypothetical protein